MENILNQEDIDSLFSEDSEDKENKETQVTPPDKTEEKETTEEVNLDELFGDLSSESVGSGEHQEGKDTTSEKETGSSPKNINFYSSIANALKDEGILPDLDDDIIKGITEPEDLAKAIQEQIKSQYDEGQRRILEALDSGVEAQTVKNFENTIAYLDELSEEAVSAEGAEGENLRKQLIFQDLINKGYSKEEAQEELEEIFSNGTDIKKAKRALNSNKEFYKNKYKELVDEAKTAREEEVRERKEQAASLKKAILEDKEAFGEITLDKATRQKVFDNISKPVYKDKETGELYTAIQKYEMENKTEFLKNVGLLFTLTDGFKNLNALTKAQVKKEVKKGIKELEKTLNNTARTSDGNLKFVTGVNDDPNSFISKWDIDI